MRKRARVLISLLTLIVMLSLFSLPSLVETKIKNFARDNFSLAISFDRFTFSLLKLDLKLDNLVVRDANSSHTIFSSKEIVVDFAANSLFKFYPIVNKFSLDSPFFELERYSNGKLNIIKHIPLSVEKNAKVDSGPLLYDIKNVTVKNGVVVLKDSLLGVSETINGINLSVYNITNSSPDKTVDLNLTLSAIDGKIALMSKLRPFDSEKNSFTSIKVDNLDIAKLGSLIKNHNIMAKGRFFCNLDINCSLGKKNNLLLNGKAGVLNFEVATQKRSIKGEEVFLVADDFNAHNFTYLNDLLLKAKELKLHANNLCMIDNTKPKELRLDFKEFRTVLRYFSSLSNSYNMFDGFFRFKDQSSINYDGRFNFEKKHIQCNLDIKRLSILPIQAVGVLPPKLNVSSGYFYTKGAFESYFAQNKSNMKYQGDVRLEKLSLLDASASREFLVFDSLKFSGLNFDQANKAAKIDTINLEGIKTDLVIDKNKKLLLLTLLDSNQTSDSKQQISGIEKPKEKPFEFSVGTIVVQDGSVNFEDQHVAPSFKSALTHLAGRISSFDLKGDKLSKIELIGRFNGQGEISIKGMMIPNPNNFYLNLKSDIREIGLPSFSTYTSKYIGHEIDSGKLGLEVDYNVVGKELTLDNKISLFGFNLGREIENPTAKKLPYNLAIAILKDSNGNIHLELPVEGRTDDPQIRSGKVVWLFIRQLVGKIVLAPFKFLGSMFSSDEQTGLIEFDFGSDDISLNQVKKIEKISKALSEKSDLLVELSGFIDGENDIKALVDEEFRKKLATQKLIDLKKSPHEWKDVKLNSHDYEIYLLKAYKAEKFSKPTNSLGYEKAIPSEDMKNLILTHIEIDGDSLRLLNAKRLKNVKDYMIKSGVNPERVLLLDNKPTAPIQKEGVKNSGVELKLHAR